MKRACTALIAMTALLTSLPASALTHKYPCDELVYDALTKEGNKRLQLCKSKGQINYNFGPTNGKSELDVLIPLTFTVMYTEYETSLEMYRGDYSYALFDNRLMVCRDEKVLADIEMRKPMVDTLMKSLLPYGVPIYG